MYKYVLEQYVRDLIQFELDLHPKPDLDYCIVVGMGGSGIIGRYLRSFVQARWAKPVFVYDYSDVEPPTHGRFLLLAVSYSGSTKETVEAFRKLSGDAAAVGVVSGRAELLELGLKSGATVAEVGGSPAPRFGFAKMFGAAVNLFGGLTGEKWVVDQLREAAGELGELCLSGAVEEHANELVGFLAEATPVVYSSCHLLPVGYRWKTQFNENVKIHAFHSPLPEANHNEVNAQGNSGTLRGVLLCSQRYDDLVRATYHAYAQVARLPLKWFWPRGSTVLAEMLYATVFGDYVSIRLAEALGVDPLRVEAINKVKSIQRVLFGEKS